MDSSSWRAACPALVIVVALSLFAGGGVEATPITVLSALSSPDETEVSLSGVVVDKVVSNPPYIVVREPWSSEIRLIILLDAPAEVQRWQTVDATGVMTTLESDARALAAASISIYKDTSGRTALMPLPVIPGDQSFATDEAPMQISGRGEQQMMDSEETPEPPSGDPPPDEIDHHLATVGEALELDAGDTVELACKPITDAGTDAEDGDYYVIGDDASSDEMRVFSEAEGDTDQRVVTVTGTVVLDSNDDKVLHVDRGPGTPRQGLAATVYTGPADSISLAKSAPAGTSVAVVGAVVSRVFAQNDFYLQNTAQRLGVRVVTLVGGEVEPGDEVTLSAATVATSTAGEVYLQATTWAVGDPGSPPQPVLMRNVAVGGADWPEPAQPAAGQGGVEGAMGPNNVGLLVCTTGRVTSISQAGYLEIDDGSCGADPCPVWVSLPSGVTPPQVGDFVIVTGASALTGSSSAPERLIRVASANDIQLVCAHDTEAPAVEVVVPSADGVTAEDFTAIHVAAADNTGITLVKVRIDSGPWWDAPYSAVTDTYNVPWTPATGEHTIVAMAYDCNGHVATTTRTVSLVDVLCTARPEAEPVSDFLFGTVVPWNAELNGIETGPAGGAGLLRKDGESCFWDPFAWQQIVALKPGSLRFGDIPANWYRWRWGVGPVEDRAPQPIGGRTQPAFSRSDYGIAEHLELCEAAGASPVVVLPFFKPDGMPGAAVEAANFIKFCTEEAGYDEDWAVTVLNRHQPQNGDPPPYVVSEPYAVGDVVSVVITGAEPDVELAFKCKMAMQANQHPEDSAPGTGAHWQAYWTYFVTEDEPIGKQSWFADESGAPAGYWGYVRQELTGSEDPFPITHWELGNQLFAMIYPPGNPPGIPEELVTPADLLDTLAAIKAEFGAEKPSIGVPVSTEREEQSTQGYYPEDVLDEDNYSPPPVAAWDFGFIVPHFYFGPADTDVTGDDYTTLFDGTDYRTLGATKIAGHERAGYLAEVGELPLPPLWVTELNTRYSKYGDGMDGQDFPHNHRLKSALGAAIVQLELAAIDALGSNLFHAANVQDGDATAPTAVDMRMIVGDKIGKLAGAPDLPVERGWVTPHYFAQKLLSALATGVADATQRPTSSSVYGQSFRDENSIRLFLVNKDPQNSQTARVYLGDSVSPAGPAVLYRLAGTNGLESTNECVQGSEGAEVHDPSVSFITVSSAETQEFELPPASLSVYDIALTTTPRELRGVVTDMAGRPIPDAPVRVSDTVTRTEYTDRLGVYKFVDLPQGDYDIEVQPNGYIVEYGEADLTQAQQAVASFTLSPRLSGTVRSSAQGNPPVPGAVVWVEPSGGGAVLASTTTDCEGNFVLPVAGGTYDVRAQHPSHGIPRAFEDADVTTTSLCMTFVLATDAQPEECE